MVEALENRKRVILTNSEDHWRGYHYAVTQVRSKNSNIQGMSHNVVKVSGANFFPLREVPTFEKGRN